MGIELVAAHRAALCLSVPSELLGLFLLIIEGADLIHKLELIPLTYSPDVSSMM